MPVQPGDAGGLFALFEPARDLADLAEHLLDLPPLLLQIVRDPARQFQVHLLQILLNAARQLPLVHVEKDGRSVMEYFDEQISKRIQLSYAGDAKFKGVRSSFPVYAVSFEG